MLKIKHLDAALRHEQLLERSAWRAANEPLSRNATEKSEVAQGEAALSLENAPLGTLAPACGGGRWFKTARGWKWNGPGGSGGTFPRPGGDWTGHLIGPVGAGGKPDENGVDTEH